LLRERLATKDVYILSSSGSEMPTIYYSCSCQAARSATTALGSLSKKTSWK